MVLQPQELILALLNDPASENATDHLTALMDLAGAGNRAALCYMGSLLRQRTAHYESLQLLAMSLFKRYLEQLEHTQNHLWHQIEENAERITQAEDELERLRLVKQLHDMLDSASPAPVSADRETASVLQDQLLELEKTIRDLQSRLKSIMGGEIDG